MKMQFFPDFLSNKVRQQYSPIWIEIIDAVDNRLNFIQISFATTKIFMHFHWIGVLS